MSKEFNNWYKRITAWLLPLGFAEVFRTNHEKPVRVDFMKDGIRVQCFFDVVSESAYSGWCRLYADCFTRQGAIGANAALTSRHVFSVGWDFKHALKEFEKEKRHVEGSCLFNRILKKLKYGV